MPEWVVGPFALTIALAYAVWRLWKLHEAADVRRDALIDTLTASLAVAVQTTRDQNELLAQRAAQTAQ